MRIFIVTLIAALPVWTGNLKLPVLKFGKPEIIETITQRARAFGVRPAVALAIAEIESSFNPSALRHEEKLKTYSVGLYQLLHTTAAYEFGFSGSVRDLKNVRTNIDLGLKYIQRCQRRGKALPCCYQAGFYAKKSFCESNEKVQAYSEKLEEKTRQWESRLLVREDFSNIRVLF